MRAKRVKLKPVESFGVKWVANIFVFMKLTLYLALLFSICLNSFSQTPPSYSSSDIFQRIQKLKVLGAVLYVAAHPDDENTRLLAWLANERQYRAGYLSLTRGDGGQNLIGDEQGIELGLIRTQELLAARRTDGAEQFFSRAFDFGYSKSTEEALRIWKKEKVLADAVWVIRNFRPDVIITRFPPDNRAGHGHHSASAVIAHEAFKAAADPKMFPEQFKYGVEPWQTKRIFWNAYNFGGVDHTNNEQLKADVGGYNTLTGKSYGEIAAESRSQHKSQGFGVPASRGPQNDFFAFTDGEKAEKDIMEGVNSAWSRIGANKIATSIDNILKGYSVANPSASVPALVKLYNEIKSLPANYWKNVKLKELEEIIAAAGGLWLEAYVSVPKVVQGEMLTVNFSANSRNSNVIQIKKISIEKFDTTINQLAKPNININFSTSLKVAADKKISQPYWLEHKMNGGSFNVNDQLLIGKPESDAAFMATFSVNIAGTDFVYTRPVKYKNTDPVKGELYHPLVVLPGANTANNYGVLRHINYDHIPDIYYFNTDTGQVSVTDVKIAGKKIGYIEGAGDKVPAALNLMGYEVSILKEKDITANYLKQFDAIITGVRAYNVHEYLSAKNSVLTEYVKNGGNLVVQYNTNSNVGPNKATIGPYRFYISRERTTDESSPVKFLLPDHQVFNFPNKITTKDFDNWVQERGIYYASQLDPAFKTPLALKDPGEEEQNGSLIIADYGKGKFVYTGLVFFRELPAGVEGAYRLFANIIALNQQAK